MDKTMEKATIMVVDDAPDNLKLLQEMLQAKGYLVLTFPRGAMALQAAAKKPPDLILLDINMPEMDGFEVCAQLKADDTLAKIPVIFISARTETSDKIKAFTAGGVDYVSKPFQFEEVHARVETHLRIRALQNQLSNQNDNLATLVAERTQELARAYDRLLELGRIKDDFLGMISHEIRTPVNGVLGIGELIIDLCPPSSDRQLYSNLFQQSSLRLRNLIDDATMITNMEKVAMKSEAISFPVLLDEVRAALSDIHITSVQQGPRQAVFLQGDSTLLARALETMIHLATSFSRDKNTVHIAQIVEAQGLRLRLDLDTLPLTDAQAAEFFEIGSTARGTSTAEALGLAPVVAYKIISAFGGEMRLVKGEGNNGYLEAILMQEQSHAKQD